MAKHVIDAVAPKCILSSAANNKHHCWTTRSGCICQFGDLLLLTTSLVPHVFQHAQENPGRPGQSGDVVRCGCISVPTRPCNEHGHCFSHKVNCVGEWAEVRSLFSNRIQLHHQINQAFLIFSST